MRDKDTEGCGGQGRWSRLKVKGVPVAGVAAVLGAFLVHLTLGTQLTYGNTNPYFVSYIRKFSRPADLRYVDGIWIQACAQMGRGVTMLVGGLVEQRFGHRVSTLLGCFILSTGVLLTYVSVQVAFYASVLTYGVLFGLGCGIAYPSPLTCAFKWFPNREGLICGIIFFGFGCGSTVFNLVITTYLNPDNISPDLLIGEDLYFTQDAVLADLPNMFLMLGTCYSLMQLTGIALLFDHKVEPDEEPFAAKHDDYDALGSDSASVSSSRHDDDVWRETALWEDGQQHTTHHGDRSMENGVKHSKPEPEAIKEKEVTSSADATPWEMLRDPQFYVVWLLFLFGGTGAVFMEAMYKSYGQLYIHDDRFIAYVGSVSALFNACGGMVWGTIADRFSFSVAVKLLFALFACLSLTLSATQFLGRAFFLPWVCLIMFCVAGKFTVMPPLIARIYGNTHLSVNSGLLHTSQIFTSLVSALMGTLLLDYLQYSGLFILIGCLSIIGLGLSFLLKTKSVDGRDI